MLVVTAPNISKNVVTVMVGIISESVIVVQAVNLCIRLIKLFAEIKKGT